MYLRAQGLRESDAYRALQLAPHAPHELIVEVYWALVSRTRQGDAPDAHGDDIGAAYALLVDEGRRPPDARVALQDSSPLGEHYAALCVDAAADAGIIDAAYSFLARNRQRMKRAQWQAIEEAYRILANPKLRAQYDVSRAASRVGVVEPRTAPPRAPEEAPRRRGLFGRGDRGSAPDARDVRLLGLRGAALASLPEPAAIATPMLALPANAIAELVFVAGPQAGLRIPLAAAAVSLGADPRHHVVLDGVGGQVGVHIWKHGDGFMLRQDGAGPVLIEGRRLDLPLVTLDDGDEIAIGSHRIRFRHIAPA